MVIVVVSLVGAVQAILVAYIGARQAQVKRDLRRFNGTVLIALEKLERAVSDDRVPL